VALIANQPALAAAPFQPCPWVQSGWALPYQGYPITFVSYDQLTGLLYVIFNNTIPSAYSGVPISVAQAFAQTRNPMPIYQSYVVPSYHALLLAEQTNCPMLNENGAYLWTN
jgi:hypothetical protein